MWPVALPLELTLVLALGIYIIPVLLLTIGIGLFSRLVARVLLLTYISVLVASVVIYALLGLSATGPESWRTAGSSRDLSFFAILSAITLGSILILDSSRMPKLSLASWFRTQLKRSGRIAQPSLASLQAPVTNPTIKRALHGAMLLGIAFIVVLVTINFWIRSAP